MLVSLPSVCAVLTKLSDRLLHMGVYSQRMRSPVGRNAKYCASLFDVSISNIATVTKRIVWIRAEAQLSDTDYDKLKVISTPLHEFIHV